MVLIVAQQYEGIYVTDWTVYLKMVKMLNFMLYVLYCNMRKTFKVMKNKEILENCKIVWETKETWWLNAIWFPGMDPRTEKGHLYQ